jgi:hypothetical protein
VNHFIRLLSNSTGRKALLSSLSGKTLVTWSSVLDVSSRSCLEAVSTIVNQRKTKLVAHPVGKVSSLFVVKSQDADLELREELVAETRFLI